MNQITLDSLSLRSDFRAIARWVEPNSSVLDLGCGDGSLLSLLAEELDVKGYGIEINDAGVLACAQKGVNVIQQNLEDGLRLFEDDSFDFAILSQTLQTIHQTAAILRETVRVGRECIVSFPNFGYWRHRLTVLQGRMPVSKHCRINGITRRTCVFSPSGILRRWRRKWVSRSSIARCCMAGSPSVGGRTGVVALRSIA